MNEAQTSTPHIKMTVSKSFMSNQTATPQTVHINFMPQYPKNGGAMRKLFKLLHVLNYAAVEIFQGLN